MKTSIDPHTCILCFQDFEDGDLVRDVHEESGAIHPQVHEFPHARSWVGGKIKDGCRNNHITPHIHNKCTDQWADKMNIDIEKDFPNSGVRSGIKAMQRVLAEAKKRASK